MCTHYSVALYHACQRKTFIRSSRTHSAVWVSACRSSSLSRPASLALHGGFIKSWDIVGRVDCSLPQLHSVIVKIALNVIRVINIFHHVSVNSPVNHFSFCAGRCRFLLARCYGFLSSLLLCFCLAVNVLAVRVPPFEISYVKGTDEKRQQNGQR